MSSSRLASAFVSVALVATVLLAKEASGYIRVQNGLFVDEDCKEFMFSGYNAWQTIEAALNMCCGNMGALQSQFQEAARQNFNVVRIFGFPVQKGFNLQTSPGVYNEQAFKGLDTVISEAGKTGLKLIIALTNNWNYNTLQTDWKCSYTNWTTTATGCDDFFTDRQAINLYKNHARKVLTRVNTITGIPYNNDSAIFGWNLMNEPRSAKDSGIQDIQSWITEVAPYVKTLANHQLVTVGEDGFYGPTTCQAWNGADPFLKNGQDQWPLHTGQDFLPNHMVDGIDYASLHLWPDNWARTDEYFGRKWLDAHLKDQWYLGKPVVIEEFGKAVGMQGGWMAQTDQTYADQYNWFKLVYDYAGQSLTSDYGYKGIMFWRWASVDPTAQSGGFDEAATITTDSGVFRDTIEPFSQKLAAWLKNSSNRKAVANCKPLNGNAALAAPAPAPALALGAPAAAPTPSALAAANIGPSNPPAFAPLRAPVNPTPGTLVNAEPGNPIVASAGPPIAAPAKLPAKPAVPGKPGAVGVPTTVGPNGVAVVNAPAGGPVIPIQSAAVPPGVPAAAPAAYVWAGANSTLPAAGRKLMQTKQNVATHASRVADAPLSAAVLTPLLAPASSPLGSVAPAVAAAEAITAATAPAPGPVIAAAKPMSSVLSITAPLAAEATVLSDVQEDHPVVSQPMAATVATSGATTTALAAAGDDNFQQRQGPPDGGPPDGPPDGPPLPLPGPGDNNRNGNGNGSGSGSGSSNSNTASSATTSPSTGTSSSTGASTSPASAAPAQEAAAAQTVVEPFASSDFTTESTFSTPAGYNAYNINYKVDC